MHLRLVSNASPVRERQARVEAAFERDFRELVDMRPQLRKLPLVVQCATRVHDRREENGALLLGLDSSPVLIAPAQRVVLVFSKSGVLETAGQLEPTRIDWSSDVTRRDWY